MSLDACAALVARGDPDRFASLMAGPLAAREKLLPLYAVNLELARAPWVTKEALIAEMRLQWWRDAVEDAVAGRVRAHEVMGPLAKLIDADPGLAPILDAMAVARVRDIEVTPFATAAELWDYLDATAGGLMWAAARALGVREGEAAVRACGQAAGLAGYLAAVAELVERGRRPLPEGSDAAVVTLADEGLKRLHLARRAGLPVAARPALLAGWQTRGLLGMAQREPQRVGAGSLRLSEFSRRAGLLWRVTTKGW